MLEGQSFSSIARRFGLSDDSLGRHFRAHVERALQTHAAGQRESMKRGARLQEQLEFISAKAEDIPEQAQRGGNLHAAAPEWQAGDWHVDRNAAWSAPFIEQITTFPNGAHDDMADAMSQAATWLLRTRMPTVTISNAFTGEILPRY